MQLLVRCFEFLHVSVATKQRLRLAGGKLLAQTMADVRECLMVRNIVLAGAFVRLMDRNLNQVGYSARVDLQSLWALDGEGTHVPLLSHSLLAVPRSPSSIDGNARPGKSHED